jgi:hypothetical protein
MAQSRGCGMTQTSLPSVLMVAERMATRRMAPAASPV